MTEARRVAQPPGDPVGARAVPLLCAGLMLWQALIFCFAPFPVLLDRMMPDDAFYYYQPAAHFARTGFSSFDGLHFTNGYQPLWFLLCVPVFWLFPDGGEAAVRLIQAMQVPLAVGAVWFLARTLTRSFGAVAAAAAAVFFTVKFGPAMMRGVEAALAMCIFGALFLLVARPLDAGPGRTRLLGLGVLCGLLFLARTDMVFALVALVTALVVRELRSPPASRREAAVRLACLLLPVALLAGGYLAVNWATTAHLMPVSGAVKLHWSRLYRDRAIAALGSPARALLANLRAFDPFVLLGAAGPWVLLALSRMRALRGHFVANLSRPWPFFCGATASFLFYALVYYDPNNRHEWYYGPHLFIACWTMAATASAAGSWLRAAGLWIGPGRLSGGARLLLRLAVIAAVATLISARPISGLHRRARSIPRGWNHALYGGAIWAREHIPAGATICSGNSGILGYFSGHRVVNTDGLVNSYAYLEDFIKPGRTLEYMTQWDYVLDGFPVDYRLEQHQPAAREMVLPPETGIEFRDGATVLRLRLYRMR